MSLDDSDGLGIDLRVRLVDVHISVCLGQCCASLGKSRSLHFLIDITGTVIMTTLEGCYKNAMKEEI